MVTKAEGSARSQLLLAEQLRSMIMGFRTTQMIHVAARLGLADLLKGGPQTAAVLAAKADADPEALGRLMRALASHGIFAETGDGTFCLTPLADLLRSDVAGSLQNVAILYGDEWLWRAYGQLVHSVRTGETAFDHVHGQAFFPYLDDHPAAGAVFHAAMSSFTDLETAALLEAYPFPADGRLVDLGGGNGAFMIALLAQNPGRRGLILDLPAAIAKARDRLVAAGLEARCDLAAGDFFSAVPSGHDIYILKRVIHDWKDDDVRSIFRNCRAAMPPHARLLVIERVVPKGEGASEAKLFDINMMATVGGKERSEEDYDVLLADSGLALRRVVETAALISIIEAVPA